MKKIRSLLLATVFFLGFVNLLSAQSVNVGTYYSQQNYSNITPQQVQPVKYPEICPLLSRTLGQGDTGLDVKRIQVVLGQEGIAYLGATGYFGPATKNAVKIFQLRNGIRTTGAVGPQTLARMRLLWCVNPGSIYNPNLNYNNYNNYNNSNSNISIQPINSSGSNVTIGWTSGSYGSCTINGSPVPPTGQQIYTVTSQTNFTLSCTQNGYGNISKTITVRPNLDLSSLPSINLSINPTTALINTYATLYWTSANTLSCSLNGTQVPASGSQQILISGNAVAYQVSCTSPNGLSVSSTIYSNTGTANSGVTSANITASTNNINSGTPVTLTWSSINTNYCSIGGVGTTYNGANGTQVVYPTQTTTYTITCTPITSGPQVSNQVTVYVNGSSGNNTNGPTVNLSTNTTTVNSGQTATLTWSSTNATYCTLSGGSVSTGNQSASGSYTFVPSSSATYTLTCYNVNNQSSSASVYITVNGTSGGNVNLTATSTTVTTGQQMTLSWSAPSGTSYCNLLNTTNNVTLANNLGVSSSFVVYPAQTTTYQLNCFNSSNNSTGTGTIVINVNGSTSGITSTLTANTTNVSANQPVVLTWSSVNASYCNISGGSTSLTNQSTSGSTTVYPTTNTTYYVTCYNGNGQASNTSQINVTTTGTSNVTATITATPNPVSAGQPVTLTWSSTNANYCTITANNSSILTNQNTAGSYVVYPSLGTNYQITCYNYNGQNGANYVYVTTNGSSSAQPTANIYSSVQNISSGQSVTLNWYSSNANTCALYSNSNLLISNQNTSGSYLVYPTQTTTYQITCTNNSNGQTANNYVTITVNGSGTTGGINVISRQNGYVVISTTYCSVYGYVDWGDNTRSNLAPNNCTYLSHQYTGNTGQGYSVRILDQNNNALSTTTLYPY